MPRIATKVRAKSAVTRATRAELADLVAHGVVRPPIEEMDWADFDRAYPMPECALPGNELLDALLANREEERF